MPLNLINVNVNFTYEMPKYKSFKSLIYIYMVGNIKMSSMNERVRRNDMPVVEWNTRKRCRLKTLS